MKLKRGHLKHVARVGTGVGIAVGAHAGWVSGLMHFLDLMASMRFAVELMANALDFWVFRLTGLLTFASAVCCWGVFKLYKRFSHRENESVDDDLAGLHE